MDTRSTKRPAVPAFSHDALETAALLPKSAKLRGATSIVSFRMGLAQPTTAEISRISHSALARRMLGFFIVRFQQPTSRRRDLRGKAADSFRHLPIPIRHRLRPLEW